MDLARGLRESEFPDIRTRQRSLFVGKQFTEVRAALERLVGVHASTKLAFDIETGDRQVTAISFSTHADSAISVPLVWKGVSIFPEEEELILWGLIRQILEGPTLKIAQNAEFDCLFLWEIYGIKVANLWMDTMLAHHVVYPELEKGLAFLCSMYTDQPYYKDDISSKDHEVFLRYNALDSCITRECADAIEQELKEFKVEQFYFGFVHKLIVPLTELGHRGIKIDMDFRAATQAKLRQEIVEYQAKLDEAAGHPLNVNSPKQMQAYLYEELKNEKQTKVRKSKKTDEKTVSVSTDAAAIEKLYAQSGNESLPFILAIRERQKLLSTYFEAAVDPDGRMRTTYKIAGTKSGRLSAAQTIFGTGLNIQNVPAGDARRLFVADPGCTFIQGDLSQAEARVVAFMANDERLIRVFAEGGDIHRRNASIIFHKEPADVTNDERQLAKRIIHASNYGMGPRQFKETCWTDMGMEVTEARARELLNMYFAQFIGVSRWHTEIQSQVKRNRTLTTPYGRKRMFFGYIGDDLFREAYSYIPQATVVDHLNKSLLDLDELFKGSPGIGATLMMQVHDSLMVQCAEKDVERVGDLMKQYMDRPVPATRNTLSFRIPVDFKVGKSWQDLKELKHA
jgi:DNA polymerase-1